MTHTEVETALASHKTDFTGKKLSGLDLSSSTCRVSSYEPHASIRPS